MRETVGFGCGSAFVLACLLAVLLLFGAVVTGLLPFQLQWQRNAVEESKSYVDAMNLQMEQAVQEHVRLDAKIVETKDDNSKEIYRGQQKQIVFGICSTMSKMKPGTTNARIVQFVNSHGGCR